MWSKEYYSRNQLVHARSRDLYPVKTTAYRPDYLAGHAPHHGIVGYAKPTYYGYPIHQAVPYLEQRHSSKRRHRRLRRMDGSQILVILAVLLILALLAIAIVYGVKASTPDEHILVTVRGHAEYDFEFLTAYETPSSNEYLILQSRICSQWSSVYTSLGYTVANCAIMDVTNGSTALNFSVVVVVGAQTVVPAASQALALARGRGIALGDTFASIIGNVTDTSAIANDPNPISDLDGSDIEISVTVRMEVSYDKVYTADLANSNSAAFQALETEVCATWRQIYTQAGASSTTCELLSVRAGRVIAEIEVGATGPSDMHSDPTAAATATGIDCGCTVANVTVDVVPASTVTTGSPAAATTAAPAGVTTAAPDAATTAALDAATTAAQNAATTAAQNVATTAAQNSATVAQDAATTAAQNSGTTA